MAAFAIIVLILFLIGGFGVLFSVVNSLAGTRRPSRSKLQSKNLVLGPVRGRFNAENLRPNRLGEVNVFRPSLVFDYGRTMAKLKHFGTPWRNPSKQTLLETDFLLSFGDSISIVSRAAGTAPPAGSMQTGDEEFDQMFSVVVSDPSVANRLLTDAVKWKMIEIRKLVDGEVTFSLEKNKLKTSCNQWFGSGQELLDFVQSGLDLFDQLMLHNTDGLEFTNENQAAVMENFRCPICSDEVMQDMVICKRCKTPHCAECWEYNGKCAMFACMEERCIRVEEQEI